MAFPLRGESMGHCFPWLLFDWLSRLHASKCQRLTALFVRLVLCITDKSLVPSRDSKSYCTRWAQTAVWWIEVFVVYPFWNIDRRQRCLGCRGILGEATASRHNCPKADLSSLTAAAATMMSQWSVTDNRLETQSFAVALNFTDKEENKGNVMSQKNVNVCIQNSNVKAYRKEKGYIYLG